VKNLWKTGALLTGAALFWFAIERIGPGRSVPNIGLMRLLTAASSRSAKPLSNTRIFFSLFSYEGEGGM